MNNPVRSDLAEYLGQTVTCEGTVTAVGEFFCLKNIIFFDKPLQIYGVDALSPNEIPFQDHLWIPNTERLLIRPKVGDFMMLKNAKVSSYHKGYCVDISDMTDLTLKRIFENHILMVRRWSDNGDTTLSYHGRPDAEGGVHFDELFVKDRSLQLSGFNDYTLTLAIGFALHRLNGRIIDLLLSRKRNEILTQSYLKELWLRQGKRPTNDLNRLNERCDILFRRLIEGRIELPGYTYEERGEE
jgi:hypothetical protein